jgi:hypothetical protein
MIENSKEFKAILAFYLVLLGYEVWFELDSPLSLCPEVHLHLLEEADRHADYAVP